MMKGVHTITVVVVFVLCSGTVAFVRADECSGLLAVGSVVADGRSILAKNRHMYENNQIPIFGKGTYAYWGIGDGITSFCRMGMNEKGLAIANFDPPKTLIDDGIWQYTSDRRSLGEDDDMATVLGKFSTVDEAAMWLAHHASYPCQWGIISQESGIGALVAMDAEFRSHITYIYDGWIPLGNVWHCTNASSANTQRIQYLIGTHLNSSDTLDGRAVVRLLGRDIQSSDSTESEPVGYNGTYETGGLTPASCRSAAVFLSGDARFDGALSMAWVAIGQTSHLCPFFPLGASYVQTAADIPETWTIGLGVEQYTAVKQAYVEAAPNVYFRDRVQELYQYLLPLQDEIFERYEMVLDGLQYGMSAQQVVEAMREYADSTFEASLQAYREGRIMASEENTVDEPDGLPLPLVGIVVVLFLVSILVVVFVSLLYRRYR